MQVRAKGRREAFFNMDTGALCAVPSIGHRVRFTDQFALVENVDWYVLPDNAFFVDVQCVPTGVSAAD